MRWSICRWPSSNHVRSSNAWLPHTPNRRLSSIPGGAHCRRLPFNPLVNTKRRQVTSPVSFLLCCIGLRRRRYRNNENLLCGNDDGNMNAGQRPRGRLGRWRGTFRRGIPSCESAAGGELLDQQGGGAHASRSALREATLGARGRRAAFERFRELQRGGACCDVTLAVGGKHFKAHK